MRQPSPSRMVVLSAAFTVGLAIPASGAPAAVADNGKAPSGRFLNPGAVAAIAAPPDADPLFTCWMVGEKQPLACQFSARPNTAYQVFVGLSEAYWDHAGKRVMDLELAGKVVATVDAFQQSKGTPSGYLFPVTTDARGRLDVRICPHPGAPDQNTVVCGVLLFPGDAAVDVQSVIHNRAPKPLASAVAGEPIDNFAAARFVNGRTDNDLVATLGTCCLDDFRFFTMLHQDAWDLLRWETIGNAVMEHRTWRNWPYEQRLRVEADGVAVSPDSVEVDQVEQQFDFRQVNVSSPSVSVERLDLMVSARQWTTALRVINTKPAPAKVAVEVEWTGKSHVPLDVRPWSDQDAKGFAYSIPAGPPTLVAIGANGTWEKRGNAAVCNRWEVELKAGEAATLDFDVYVGWAALPVYRDKGPGMAATEPQATLDRRADQEGLRRVAAGLGAGFVSRRWSDLQKLCDARRHYLYDRMPRLQGFEPEWAGMWAYTFDLIRSGLCPAQGNFKDVWKVESLDVYREPFYWDGPASVHSFCNWDGDLSARTLRTFLTSTKADGELCVSANPYRVFANPTPQLANITMALWDCYQITRDKDMLASCYPLIVKHVRWLETKRNRSPNGPLMDVGYNIDYGPPSLYAAPTIWPDVQFFLVDRYQRLARIAAVIGRPQEEIAEWTERANRLAEGIRKHMWDDKNGTFWCVSDKLDFKPVASPIEFHAMIAGVASPDQARRLLIRLKDPAKYAPSAKHPYGLPSAPFDSPLFVVKDSWSGTIWPVQTYYAVRGLVDYGYQDEAAALSANLYGMMARDYRKSGSIWEQYDPNTGNDLSRGYQGSGSAEIGRGYFTSGITTSVADMLLRGLLGFARTDEPLSFRLNPRPLKDDWHGVDNLVLNTGVRMNVSLRKAGGHAECRLRFAGLNGGAWKLVLTEQRQARTLPLDDGAVAFSCKGAEAIHCQLAK